MAAPFNLAAHEHLLAIGYQYEHIPAVNQTIVAGMATDDAWHHACDIYSHSDGSEVTIWCDGEVWHD